MTVKTGISYKTTNHYLSTHTRPNTFVKLGKFSATLILTAYLLRVIPAMNEVFENN